MPENVAKHAISTQGTEVGFTTEIAKHVLQLKNKMGGNFVISKPLKNRIDRHAVKMILDTNFIIINLKLQSKELIQNRLENRHGDVMSKAFIRALTSYTIEDFSNDGEKTFEIVITEDMSKDEVYEKICEITGHQGW